MNKSWQNGAAYDRFMGRWSALAGGAFLRWLAVEDGRAWLDVGCGTGQLTRAVLATCRPAAVTALDASFHFASYARQSVSDPRAQFLAGAAQAMPLAPNAVDCAVSGLVLNFVPRPEEAAAEMLRVTRPGGTIAAFVWDYAQGMQFLRYFWDAAAALDPAAAALDEGDTFPVCRPGGLTALLREAGGRQVQSCAVVVPTVFASFDDYWQPFLGGTGVGPAYVARLSQPQRDALAERLRASLPAGPGGEIALTARAWAARAEV